MLDSYMDIMTVQLMAHITTYMRVWTVLSIIMQQQMEVA